MSKTLVTVPEGSTGHLKPGSTYVATPVTRENWEGLGFPAGLFNEAYLKGTFRISRDQLDPPGNVDLFCMYRGCNHIGGGDWLVEEVAE